MTGDLLFDPLQARDGRPNGVPPRARDVRPWTGLRRILAVRLDAAGDVLMTSPALRALRTSGVEHLALLTSPSGAAAARLLPELDEVIEYEAPWMKASDARSPSHDLAM